MEYLERITPTEAGIRPEAIEGFLKQIKEQRVHLHSFRMIRGDKVFAEGNYAPYGEGELHILFSLSKSFTATAMGFAVQEGLISLEDRLVDYFQEELRGRTVSENTKKITIRHLLTMNTGKHYQCDEILTSDTEDWILNYLYSPTESEPGTWFLYDNRAVFMEAVLIERLTGEHVVDYLRTRLFEPLGCSERIWWENSPTGYNAGGYGLSMPIEDIAKFGVFVKNHGSWKGKQLLNPEWFEEASQMWSDTTMAWQGEWSHGYGYHFWGCRVPGTYRGDGAFGQFCVVAPKEDLLFVTNSGQPDLQKVLDAFWDHIYPETAVEDKEEQGTAKEKEERLREHLKHLTLPAYYEEKLEDLGVTKEQMQSLKLPENVTEKTYRLSGNPMHLTSLAFRKKEENMYEIELGNGRSRDRFLLTPKDWTRVFFHIDSNQTNVRRTGFRTGLYEKGYAKGCTVNGTLYLDIFFHNTTAQDTWEIIFQDEKLKLRIKRNTGGISDQDVIIGEAETA